MLEMPEKKKKHEKAHGHWVRRDGEGCYFTDPIVKILRIAENMVIS